MASLPAKQPHRRLPTLTISPNAHSLNNDFIISPNTPDEYYTPLSSTSSESATFSAFIDGDEKLAQDLAVLEKLRRSVHLNLQLRPISSSSSSSSSPSSSFLPSRQGHRSPAAVSPTVCSPESLVRRLSSPTRPLLIDTRSTSLFNTSRIAESVNIIMPSLMLKRQRKAAGSVNSIHSLRNFITSEAGKQIWDDLLAEQDLWDGTVIVYDEKMDDRERDSALSWNLLSLIGSIFQGTPNIVMYLHGGLSAFRHIPNFSSYITSNEDNDDEDESNYHFSPIAAIISSPILQHSSQLSQSPSSTPSPQTEASCSRTPRAVSSVASISPDLSPKSLISDVKNSSSQFTFTRPFLNTIVTLSPPPLPAPGQLYHRASQPNLHDSPSYSIRKASVPNLHKLDTSSLGRLSIKTQNPLAHSSITPSRTLTLPTPLEGSSRRMSSPRSPSFLSLRGDNVSSTHYDQGIDESLSHTPVTAFFTATSGSFIPRPPSPPMTARPLPTSPTSEVPTFTVSCILPNFLFLGSELTTKEHVQELQELGVKRILNLAAECDPDDHGLDLRNSFERYIKIAMRDTVEEENVNQGVREVCECLDDARLHSSPTYVHCKAGKSRSVTAVMAYLIHANHWTLSQAYAFVLERRKGISPNIGFVSELMNFEEQELGGKSVGVVPKTEDDDGPSGDNHGHGANYGYGASMRRNAHMRESLPPGLTSTPEIGLASAVVANDSSVARVGDQGQELEIKDSSGRYRHKRRAPVDENTLQPSRRVSKAGLESGDWT